MILVFVGAGGSAAVDPEQYPTTVEFFERLPGEITQDPLFTLVREFLQHKKGEEPIDIEKVLWRLDDLQSYFSLSRNTNTIAGWSMAENRISRLIGNAPDLSNLLNGMSNSEIQFQNLKNKINAQVYKFYATPPDSEKLSDWIQLLKGLEKPDSSIEIFTTNYDRVLERVISESGINIETGLKPNPDQMELDITLWDSPGQPLDNNYGRLTKLHGSVNWQRSAEGIVVSNPIFTGDHQNHLILYPGYKEELDQEPFIKFHRHLEEVVFKTDIAIFIGFAFRDDEINDILSYLPSKSRKYVINKNDSLPDLDFLRGNECEHFNKGLTAETVEACLRSLYPQNTQEYDDSDFKANSAYLDTLPPISSSQSPSTKES